MAASPAIFEDLVGQAHAARFLSEIVVQGQPSHAYMFLGPRGVGKLSAALRFAAALCCEQGGCGECHTCEKAARGAHPDIQTISAAGSFVTVEQVREMNRSLSLRPSESRARVFIFRDAGSFNAESANAFLKSLEEPPSFVYFILLADSADRLLATLASRCQSVRFSPLQPQEIEDHLIRNFPVNPVEARAYARIAAGSLETAVSLCQDEGMAARRRRYIEIGKNVVKGAWEGGAGHMAAEIVSAAQEAASLADEAGPEQNVPEGFITSPKKRQEEDARRRAASAQRRELAFALGILQSWFRDLMVVAAGASEAVLNRDFELELEDLALPSKLGAYEQALSAVKAAREKLGYNVDVELALQAMFFNLQEVL